MAGQPDEVLKVGLALEAETALKQMAKFQREMLAQLKQVGKASKKETKASAQGFEKMADAVEDLTDSTERYEKVVKGLRQRASEASGKALEDLEEQIRLVEKIIQKKQKAQKTAPRKGGGSKGGASKGGDAKKEANEALKESAGAFRDAASSFFSKDAKGVFSSLMKGLGTGLKGSFKRVELGSTNLGTGLRKTGAGIAERGREKGGVGGAAMGGLGKALQGIGGMFSKIGSLVNTVSKLGPLLGVAASSLMAVVKLFIDAEAQAKQFQKEVLQSASTAEFLAASGGNANLAFADLSDTMKEIRDSAFSLDNLKWGINADDHKQVVNVLNQEGVSLRRMKDEAESAKKTVGQFATELTHVSVAYSRAFGVPLQEINQMQAEMMTELGMSLETTRLQFAQMTRSAAESGIASNKFFAIIRGVSADLSLYNSRLEDAVKTLKLLGKVMNPREAQKFMQTAMQALKGMGRTDLLKTALLGGPGTAKALQRDLDRKAKSIGEDIAKAGGQAGLTREDLLSKPVEELLAGVNEEQQGALRSALADLRMDTKASKQGVFGQAMAMRNAGPAASLQMMKNSLNIAGTGKLADRIGDLGTQMLAENQGISMEQLAGMAKFEMAIDDTKAALIAGLKKNSTGVAALDALIEDQVGDPATLEKLAKAGITATEAGVQAANTDQIFDTMSASEKELAKVDAGIQDAAQAQSKLTSSLLDKLGTLVDFVMNQVYNVLLGIWEAITDLPGFGDSKAKENIRLMRQIKGDGKGGKSETLLKAASDAKPEEGGAGVRGAIMGQEGGDKLFRALKAETKGNKAASTAKLALVQSLYGKAGSQATIKAVEDVGGGTGAKLEKYLGLKKLEQDKAEMKRQGRKQTDIDYYAKGETERLQNVKSLNAGTVMRSQVDPNFKLGLSELREAGLNLEEILDVATKLGWHMKPEDLVAAFPDLEKQADAVMASVDPQVQIDTAKSSATTADATRALNEHGTVKKNSIYVRFGSAFLKGDYQKTIEEATLASLRKALFEYFMYSDMDPQEVAKFLAEEGMTGQQFAETVGKKAEEGRTPKDFTGLGYVEADKNASGGLVTGVNGGLAMVRAAAGEGLASVGPGERIVPAGAGRGGDQFHINVNGIGGSDLARFLQVKVADGIVEYKRRQRYV